ncbi:MAG: cyclic nucleotide-binding domain-containing protein [Chlamydiales bacterium]|nr:cyclic nucleotide-binding domain-containing protein [Chlamydiia bacterium]MCP5508218.1 cyclic nucleotide-binding domain-containing protein [Chlamydiales bacterium]
MKPFTLMEKAFIIKQTPLFSALDLDSLLPIADKLNTMEINTGDIVFATQEHAYSMYFLVEGRIEIRDEDDTVIDRLSPIDFFGDESLFNGQPRSYEARAQTPCTLLILSRTNIMTIISEFPNVGIELLEEYTAVNTFRRRGQP